MSEAIADAGAARRDYRVTFAVVLVGVASYALLQSLVLPVLPTIEAGLHTSQSAVTWVLTAYLLSASIFTPVLGRVGDMFGKGRVFVIALSALAVGSLLGALANDIGLMIVARAIQGIGGGVLPLAFGIIRDEMPRHKVPGAVGITAALTALGGGVGLILGGPITNALNFHFLFWLPMIPVTLAAIAAQVVIPPSLQRSPGRVSPFAVLTLSGWLIALLVAVSEAPTWGWGSPTVLGLFAGSALLAYAWVRIELASPQPLVDMVMMRIGAVWTTNLVALLFGVGMYSAFAFLPEFVQTPSSHGYGFGASATASGLFLLPMAVVMFLAGLASGRLCERMSARVVLLAGSAITLVAFVILTIDDTHRLAIYLSMSVMGAGIGLGFSAMSNVIVGAVPHSQTGVATGMNANIRTIGGSIGAAVMSSIVTSTAHHSIWPTRAGYTHGFTMLAIAAAAATAASAIIPRRARAELSVPVAAVAGARVD